MPKIDNHIIARDSTRKPDYVKLYQALGYGFSKSNSRGEAVAEECPFCLKDKYHLNVETGQYHCKHCDEQGNLTTFLTWFHRQACEATTSAEYSNLGKLRGIAPQTLRSHELAYCERLDCWLIPFKGSKGSVSNLQLYHHSKPKPNKFNLPGLPTCVYGFDKLLAASKDKLVVICEGPFDAIALDYHLKQNRGSYVITATPGTFKEDWVQHYTGRRVLAMYDNDDAGRKHSERVVKLLSGKAKELSVLRWPDGFPNGCDVNDLARNDGKHSVGPIIAWAKEHSYQPAPEPKLAWDHGWKRDTIERPVIEWVWPHRLRCGSYISYSGFRGTMKSTVMRDLAARYTAGRPMPCCDAVGLPAGHVIYITAEDSPETVWGDLMLNKAVKDRCTVLPATLKDGDAMNILDHMDELRSMIRQLGVRLVIIDGQNSVVGAPNISTDMLARHNVTNKLHQFAQKENICLVGVRNEDPEGRALGPASMADISRGIVRSVEEDDSPLHGQRYFRLVFERISDAAPSTHPPIPYSVQDLGGSSRRILWEKEKPQGAEAITAHLAADAAQRKGRRRAKTV